MSATHKDFLVELGCEELPPKALRELAKSFMTSIQTSLSVQRLEHGKVEVFATPRRLAVLVNELSIVQSDTEVERKGPPIKIAFDDDGNPTKAAEKFAEGNGVTVDELDRLISEKGEYLIYRGIEQGKPTETLLADIVKEALDNLPIPKRMRWGSSEVSFVRPVHWLVMLFDHDVIECEILGLKADRITHGHRFMSTRTISIEQPSAYKNLLHHVGEVIADFSERRSLIQEQAENIAKGTNGEALIDEDLLNEVTALVEMPEPVLGDFDKRFLNLPREVLISTLQEHQKYFPVTNANGKLLPHFITISNIRSKEPAEVKAGNERVILPRLADAEFFWNSDLKTKLADRVDHLDKVVFQRDLGSLGEKVKRVTSLGMHIAENIDADPALVERSALLCKCDLLTDMVGEFPDLQGTMGAYYAQAQDEHNDVVRAIREHYLPRFSGDELPSDKISQALSIADKLDTIVGIFAIGKKPTGTRDPFSLRRQSIGVLRILAENKFDLDVPELIQFSLQQLPEKLHDWSLVTEIKEYIDERSKGYYIEKGYTHDQIAAVLKSTSPNPRDQLKRLKAIKGFVTLPAAPNLAAANKRVNNILKQNAQALEDLPEVKINRMTEKAEYALHQALQPLHNEIDSLVKAQRYKDVLIRLARLREPIDDFFDQVMVMSDDEDEKNNRLNLLRDFKQLSSSVADLSLLDFVS